MKTILSSVAAVCALIAFPLRAGDRTEIIQEDSKSSRISTEARDGLFAEIEEAYAKINQSRTALRTKQKESLNRYMRAILAFETKMARTLANLEAERRQLLLNYEAKATTQNTQLQKLLKNSAGTYSQETSTQLLAFDADRRKMEEARQSELQALEKRRTEAMQVMMNEYISLHAEEDTALGESNITLSTHLDAEITRLQNLKAKVDRDLAEQRSTRKALAEKARTNYANEIGVTANTAQSAEIPAVPQFKKMLLINSPFAQPWEIFSKKRELDTEIVWDGETLTPGPELERVGRAVSGIFAQDKPKGFSISEQGNPQFEGKNIALRFYYLEDGKRVRFSSEEEFRLSQKFLWSVAYTIRTSQIDDQLVSFRTYRGKLQGPLTTELKSGKPIEEVLDTAQLAEIRNQITDFFRTNGNPIRVNDDGDFLFDGNIYRVVWIESATNKPWPDADQAQLRQLMLKHHKNISAPLPEVPLIVWQKLAMNYSGAPLFQMARNQPPATTHTEPFAAIELAPLSLDCKYRVWKISPETIRIEYQNNGRTLPLAEMPLKRLSQIACSHTSFAYVGPLIRKKPLLVQQILRDPLDGIGTGDVLDEASTLSNKNRDENLLWIFRENALVRHLKSPEGIFRSVLAVEDREFGKSFQVWSSENGNWSEVSAVLKRDGTKAMAAVGGEPPVGAK